MIYNATKKNTDLKCKAGYFLTHFGQVNEIEQKKHGLKEKLNIRVLDAIFELICSHTCFLKFNPP